jgi:riboflavin transporter FmnP
VKALSTLVFVAATAWVSLRLWDTRRRLRRGDIVTIPNFVATLVFGLCIVASVLFGFSALHLLWLFPLSAGVGVFMRFFRPDVSFTMACLGLLVSLKPYQGPNRGGR